MDSRSTFERRREERRVEQLESDLARAQREIATLRRVVAQLCTLTGVSYDELASISTPPAPTREPVEPSLPPAASEPTRPTLEPVAPAPSAVTPPVPPSAPTPPMVASVYDALPASAADDPTPSPAAAADAPAFHPASAAAYDCLPQSTPHASSAYSALPASSVANDAYAPMPIAAAQGGDAYAALPETATVSTAYDPAPVPPVTRVAHDDSSSAYAPVPHLAASKDAYAALPPASATSTDAYAGIPLMDAAAVGGMDAYSSVPSDSDPMPILATPMSSHAPAHDTPSHVAPSAAAARRWNVEWQEAMDAPCTTDATRLERLMRLITINNDFMRCAETTVTQLVNDLLLPPSARHFAAADVGGLAGGEKFIHDGIFFKFARDWRNIYGGDAYAIKAASLEMANTRVIMAAAARAFQPDTPVENKVSVPLCALLDYGGFRILAAALLPVGSSTLVYGSADAGVTINADDAHVNGIMAFLAEMLNIKTHVVGDGAAARTLAWPADIEVHRGRDSRLYVVDTARVFPPEAPSSTIQGFLMHAQLVAADGGSATSAKKAGGSHGPATATASVLDISRASALQEITEVLSHVGMLGGDAVVNRSAAAGVRRLELPGAAMYVNAAANPHIRSNSVHAALAPLSPDDHASLARIFGVNRIALSLAMSLISLADGGRAAPLIIYGDAIVVTGERGQHLYAQLRSECVRSWVLPLSSDAFSRFGRVRADVNNKEVSAATQYLLQTVLPGLARALVHKDVIICTQEALVRRMHTMGLSVRHLGMLRVLLGNETQRGTQDVVLRLKSLILTHMVSRVCKHLLREAMRGLTTTHTHTPSGAPTEDARIRLVRECLNRVFARVGAWADVRGAPAPDTDALWRIVIRTHVQLKFGAQLPALSAAELNQDYDLRTHMSVSTLAGALITHAGIALTPAALYALTCSSSHVSLAQAVERLSPRTTPAVRHTHDAILLPRIRTHPCFTTSAYAPMSREHLNLFAARGKITANVKAEAALPAASGGDAAIYLIGWLPASLRTRDSTAMWETLNALTLGPSRYSRNPGTPMELHRSKMAAVNASSLPDEVYLHHTFGSSYAYTHIGSVCDKSRGEHERHMSSYTQRVLTYASAGRVWPAVPNPFVQDDGGERSQHQLERDDITELVCVRAGVYEDEDVCAQMETVAWSHAAAAVKPGAHGAVPVLRALAHACVQTSTPAWDVMASMSVTLSNQRESLHEGSDWHTIAASDTAELSCVPGGVSIAVSNLCVHAPPTMDAAITAMNEGVAPSCACVDSCPDGYDRLCIRACLAAYSDDVRTCMATSSSVCAWDLILHPGYDHAHVRVGVAAYPLTLSRSGDDERYWTFAVHDFATRSGNSSHSLASSLEAAGMSRADVALVNMNRTLWRMHSEAPDVVTCVAHVQAGTLTFFVNGVRTGACITNIPFASHGDDSRSGSQVYTTSLRPIALCNNSGSVAKVTIAHIRGGRFFRFADVCGIPGAHHHTSGAGTARHICNGQCVLSRGQPASEAITTSLSLHATAVRGCLRTCARALSHEHAEPQLRLAHTRSYAALCEAAFGSAHRICADAHAHVAQAMWDSRIHSSTDLIGFISSKFVPDAPAPRTRSHMMTVPQHVCVRIYLMLGDMCLGDVGSTNVMLRARRAEAWYVRALTAVAMHSPTAATRAANLDLLRMTHGVYQHPTSNDSRDEKVDDLEALCMSLHPHAIVILDRLLGVLHTQGRTHHAGPFLRMFALLWRAFPCPIHFQAFLSPERHAARCMCSRSEAGWGYGGVLHAPLCQSPYILAFGHAVPHAATIIASNAGLMSGWGVDKDLFRRPASNSFMNASWARVNDWLDAVTCMTDTGHAHDITTHGDFGVHLGPLPSSLGQLIDTAALGASSQDAVYSMATGGVDPSQMECSAGSLLTWSSDISEGCIVLPLARGTRVSAPTGGALVHDEAVACVASRNDATVCVTTHGRAFTWLDRRSESTQRVLGVGDSDEKVAAWTAYPLRTLLGKRLAAVACGNNFTVLLDTAGVVYTYGDGSSGALGHGDTTSRSTPRAVRALEGIAVAAITAGASHVVAATASPNAATPPVYAWGGNRNGCCGVGNTAAVPSPTGVKGIYRTMGTTSADGDVLRPARVTQLSAGDTQTGFVTEDGALFRCGDFSWQVGTSGDILVPQLLLPAHDVHFGSAPGDVSVTDAVVKGALNGGSTGSMQTPCSEGPQYIQARASFVSLCADARVRFIDVVVSRANMFAVSDDGRLWSFGRSDLGATGHAHAPNRTLTRVPGLGPRSAHALTHVEAGCWDESAYAVAVHPDAEHMGGFVTVARRTSAGRVAFDVLSWSPYGRNHATLATLEGLETGFSARSPASYTPAPMALLRDMTHPVAHVEASNNIAYAVVASNDELQRRAEAMLEGPTDDSVLPHVHLSVYPSQAFPGQQIQVTWSVPHDVVANNDSIGILPVVDGVPSHVTAGSLHPLAAGPRGSSIMSAPSGPGDYLVTYFVGYNVQRGSESLTESCCSRIQTRLTVASSVDMPSGATQHAVEVNAVVGVSAIEPRTDAKLLVRLAVHALVDATVHPATASMVHKGAVPFTDDDMIVLLPRHAWGAVHGADEVDLELTDTTSTLASIAGLRMTPVDEDGLGRGAAVVRAPLLAAESLSPPVGRAAAVSRTGEPLSHHAHTFNIKKLMGSDRCALMFAPLHADTRPTAIPGVGVHVAAHVMLHLPGSAYAGDEYMVMYLTPSQRGALFGTRTRCSYVPVSYAPVAWGRSGIPRCIGAAAAAVVASVSIRSAQMSRSHIAGKAVTLDLRIRSAGLGLAALGWRLAWVSDSTLRAVKAAAAAAAQALVTVMVDSCIGSAAIKPDAHQRKDIAKTWGTVLERVSEEHMIGSLSLQEALQSPATLHSLLPSEPASSARVSWDKVVLPVSLTTPASRGRYTAVLVCDEPLPDTSFLPTVPSLRALDGARWRVLVHMEEIDVTMPTTPAPSPAPAAGSAAAVAQPSVSAAPAAVATAAATDATDTASEEEILSLRAYDEAGGLMPNMMETSGPLHARMLKRVLATYEAMYRKNNIPEAMLAGIMSQVSSSVGSSPVIGLKSVFESIRTQLG